jgi:hypothetical protein
VGPEKGSLSSQELAILNLIIKLPLIVNYSGNGEIICRSSTKFPAISRVSQFQFVKQL